MAKTIVIIFVWGDALESRVLALCKGYGVSLYTFPRHTVERLRVYEDTMNRLSDMEVVCEISSIKEEEIEK